MVEEKKNSDIIPTYTLPNKLRIYHFNKLETDFLYKEIFDDRSYLQHGIALKDGDILFDVGANIGMFTIFACLEFPNISVYAFEPIPPIFEVLTRNTEAFRRNVKLFNYGLSDLEKTVHFAFLPNFSVLSGMYVDGKRDGALLKSFITHQFHNAAGDQKIVQRFIERFMQGRLAQEDYPCQVRALSQMLEEHPVPRIDLLKIDVEKSEFEMMEGIQEKHWELIRQIVMELHDVDEAQLQQLIGKMEKYDFQVHIAREKISGNLNTHMIYAQKSRNER